MDWLRRRIVVPLIVASWVLGGGLTSGAAPALPRAGGAVHATALHSVAAVSLPTADYVPNPVVWLVGVESFSPGPAAAVHSDVTLGSGFVVSTGPDGAWVATAGHVVRSNGVAVYLVGGRRPHLADRLVRSRTADLALVHVPSLRGVAAAPLSAVPISAWSVEVACVRWPGWSYQSYAVPVGPRSFDRVRGTGPVLLTPSLAVLPGCSGGPLIAYRSAGGETPTVVGVTINAVTEPTGVGYVSASTVQALLRAAGGS